MEHTSNVDRRTFMKTSAVAVAGTAMAASGPAAANDGDGLIHRNERPDRMTYRKLGKTNFMSSRIVFGCGAALSGGKAVTLLEHAFDAGVNHYDVGSNAYYKGAENHLGPFMKKHRGQIWVTSKAPVRLSAAVRENEPMPLEVAKDAAKLWTTLLDKSLQDLDTDHIDAYYIMMVNLPQLVRAEPMRDAFLAAKEAGKVSHFGISTHQRADECLAAAAETGWYSQAMVAITPAGWYDLTKWGPTPDGQSLKQLQPALAQAREAGIGIIGMKAAQFLASKPREGEENRLAVFDKYYPAKLTDSSLTPFQRSYAYCLENGIDVMNSDMQNVKHFEENVLAARTSGEYFA